MMKGMIVTPQEQENMSNLTSASGDQTSVCDLHTQEPPKKKRNLPGNPDPDAEVITLSPKTLMATNRFKCEICNKGFQREQNLQLHRRGHNLPWKLKQRHSKEVTRKKVYVCPEASCVHHHPSRALGDLTGIKKHFCRKHGEKKWKCEKCTKCYAVQSDLKAHSKICGTREYRCDCGTLFSRRDSFITHRAFCDALAEESAKSIATGNIHHPLLHSSPGTTTTEGCTSKVQPPPHILNTNILTYDKKEQQSFSIGPMNQGPQSQKPMIHHHHFNVNQNPNPGPAGLGGPILINSSPHMSATALLQKAAQMGATMSSITSISDSTAMIRPHHQGPMPTNTTTGFGLHLSSCYQQQLPTGFLSSFGNKAAPLPTADHHQETAANSFLQDMMMMSQGFVDDHQPHQTFDQDYGFTAASGFLNQKKDDQKIFYNIDDHFQESASSNHHRNDELVISGNDDGMTRDFLGLRPLSHAEILSIAALQGDYNQDHN